MKKLHILLLLIVLVTVFSYLFYKEGSLPVNKNDKISKIFIIKQGESLNTIVNNLSHEGLISNKHVIPEIEFDKLADEGYLFPDTYLVPKTATAETVLSIIKNNFNNKFDESLHTQARNKKLTEKQVLIFASLVEREARHPAPRQKE